MPSREGLFLSTDPALGLKRPTGHKQRKVSTAAEAQAKQTNMNTATNLGIAAVNEARQKEVASKAASYISLILDAQTAIKRHEETIKLQQDAVKKIADDAVTQSGVMGTEFTGELNANQVTIAKAIKDINDKRQEDVKYRSQGHLNSILGAQKNIADLNKQISDWRTKLNELSVDVVTTAVVG